MPEASRLAPSASPTSASPRRAAAGISQRFAAASSLAGAIFAGVYGGIAAWALTERSRLDVADRNLVPSVAGVVGALGLVAAALVLERACRVPKQPDDEDDTGDDGSK